jgi:hypothetical protein
LRGTAFLGGSTGTGVFTTITSGFCPVHSKQGVQLGSNDFPGAPAVVWKWLIHTDMAFAGEYK